jgi:surfactin synthase thioesterase subunit
MSAASSENTAWIRRYHQSPPGVPRLVCLPHAGGAATYFFPTSRALSAHAEVVAIQYPGRQDRREEACVDNLHDLADMIYLELKPWTDQPLALFGHSMGASLAFEIAHRLEREGHQPLVLFASGRRAPSRHRAETVHLMDDEALIRDLKKLAGTDARMLGEREVLEMILPALRSDYRAAETYRATPGIRLGCPITVLYGTDDPQVTLEEAQTWADHTVSGCTVRIFPGGHFFLNDHAVAVHEEIAGALAAAYRA